MAVPSDSSLSIASSDENQSLPLADLETLIKQHAKYKERSCQTSKGQHVPFLNYHPSEPHVVLFGDSMLERMKATGGSPDLHPWPSMTMLSASALERISSSQELGLRRIDGVFNAGVGGDKIENMLYRLLGDQEEKMIGLISIFSKRNVRLWIVQAGTNNLHQKHGHRDKDRDLLRLLLQTLLKISHTGAIILLTELFYRKDIPDDLVDKANEKMRSLVASMNTNLGREAIVSLPAPTGISKDEHLIDHVHLNLKGYQAWAETLMPKAASMLDKVERSKN